MELKEELIEDLTNNLCVFLKMERPLLSSRTIEDRVREIVVAKLCEVINIKCVYNYKNDTFYFFSMLVGEVVVNKLGYNISVSPSILRLYKYNGVNLVNEVDRIITVSPLNEAFINCFELLDELTNKIEELKIKKYN